MHTCEGTEVPADFVPADFVVEGSFPDGVFSGDTPPSVYDAAAVAQDLKAEMALSNVCRVAARWGLERSALYAICAGRAWPCMGNQQR